MKLAIVIGVVMLLVAGAIFAFVAGALYIAYTDPACTEFGPLTVLMTLPTALGAVLAWIGLRLLEPPGPPPAA